MTEHNDGNIATIAFLLIAWVVTLWFLLGLLIAGALDQDVKGCAEAIIVHEVALSQAELDGLGGPNQLEIDEALRCVEEYREKWR